MTEHRLCGGGGLLRICFRRRKRRPPHRGEFNQLLRRTHSAWERARKLIS